MNDERKPTEYDAVLGGNNPPPVDGLVLGGIEGVKRRLESNEIKVRIAAVRDALNYSNEGLDLVIQALQDEFRQVQQCAYKLLRNKEEELVKEALANYQPWNLRERFQEYPGYQARHAEVFANRQVENFNIDTGIVDPVNIAYAFRYSEWERNQTNIDIQFNRLLEDSQINKLEALVFGQGIYNLDFLVKNQHKLNNLKAIFWGDIHFRECEISWLYWKDNFSPILEAYPNLEVLQVRGTDTKYNGFGKRRSLEDIQNFNPIKHDNLQTLIIESGGINKVNIRQICNLELPALEHLELWLGTKSYGGNSSIDDLMPILSGESHPNLIYLGLRNSEYTTEISTALVDAPILNTILVLDLSMGTLTNKGAEVLLNCPEISKLKILNISENYLSNEIVNQFQQLDIEVIADRQKVEEDEYYDEKFYRYCSVAE